jgi:hypothetical protein
LSSVDHGMTMAWPAPMLRRLHVALISGGQTTRERSSGAGQQGVGAAAASNRVAAKPLPMAGDCEVAGASPVQGVSATAPPQQSKLQLLAAACQSECIEAAAREAVQTSSSSLADVADGGSFGTALSGRRSKRKLSRLRSLVPPSPMHGH